MLAGREQHDAATRLTGGEAVTIHAGAAYPLLGRLIDGRIAEGDVSSLGDTSTLADPAVVDDLVANRVS